MASTRFQFLSSLSRQLSSSTNVRHATQAKPRSEEIRQKRVSTFDKEWKRQQALVTRLEKIEAVYESCNGELTTLIMNKGVSTPFNCAQHLSELLTKRSAVAQVNGALWDMHRPLEADCRFKLLHMKPEEPSQALLVNKVFWRSCSFFLGAVLDEAFKEDITVTLHSFPPANVRSGSFVYDIQLNLDSWQPSQNDLRIISASFQKYIGNRHDCLRLEVDSSVALKMFEDNPFKAEQVPDIAAKSESGSTVTVYRVGNHIDISRGPMLANTGLVGRCSIVSVHNLGAGLYRFQGVALPSDIFLNHFAYGILESRARKLNPARTPSLNAPTEV